MRSDCITMKMTGWLPGVRISCVSVTADAEEIGVRFIVYDIVEYVSFCRGRFRD